MARPALVGLVFIGSCLLPRSLADWRSGYKGGLSLHFCGEIYTVTSDRHLRLIRNVRCIYRYAYPLGQMTFPLSPNEIFQVIHYRRDAWVAEGSIAHQINLAVIVISGRFALIVLPEMN